MPPLRAQYCATFFSRLKGLMGRGPLPENTGILLDEKRDSRMDAAIHMLFMRIDLAVVWINSAGEVVDVCLARRWRPAYLPARPARYILETGVERLDDFHIGDKVRFEQMD